MDLRGLVGLALVMVVRLEFGRWKVVNGTMELAALAQTNARRPATRPCLQPCPSFPLSKWIGFGCPFSIMPHTNPPVIPQDWSAEASFAAEPAKAAGADSLKDVVIERFQAVVARLGSASSLDNLNLWLGLANNIWNATPQPDRGGKTALELSARWRSRPRTVDK